MAQISGTRDRYQLAYPEKLDAGRVWHRYRIKTNLITPEGYEAHHWNYNYGTDIILLSREKHKEAHRQLVYDQKTFCFKTLTGELLDTKRKHWEYLL